MWKDVEKTLNYNKICLAWCNHLLFNKRTVFKVVGMRTM